VPKKVALGRIHFPGNPWPKGHAVKKAVWSGALVAEDGLYFDLHLETADYAAEGEGKDLGDDDWVAPGVWENYQACTLSSSEWGARRAFRVADRKHPFSFAKLKGKTFKVDPLPRKDRPVHDNVFDIYLLGHDATGDHRIRFSPKRTAGVADVDWRGKICLAYVGSTTFDRRFDVALKGLTFHGFRAPDDLDGKAARRAAEPFLADPSRWKTARRKDAVWIVPA
jgi:hypothetical protein